MPPRFGGFHLLAKIIKQVFSVFLFVMESFESEISTKNIASVQDFLDGLCWLIVVQWSREMVDCCIGVILFDVVC